MSAPSPLPLTAMFLSSNSNMTINKSLFFSRPPSFLTPLSLTLLFIFAPPHLPSPAIRTNPFHWEHWEILSPSSLLVPTSRLTCVHSRFFWSWVPCSRWTPISLCALDFFISLHLIHQPFALPSVILCSFSCYRPLMLKTLLLIKSPFLASLFFL